MHLITDIYEAEYGDSLKIQDDGDGVTIPALYAELLTNHKLGRVTHYPGISGLLSFNKKEKVDSPGFYLIEITRDITATELAKMLVISEFCGENSLSIEVPSHINLSTLKNVMYELMREWGVWYSLTTGLGVLVAKKKGPNKTNHKKMVEKIISDMVNKGSVQNVSAPQSMSSMSFMKALYKEALLQGTKIEIRRTGKSIMVEKTNNSDKRIKGINFSFDFDRWIEDIQYDTPTRIPDDLIAQASPEYIKVKLTLSKHDCSYRKGIVTKHKVRIKRSKGMQKLMIRGICVAESKELTADVIISTLNQHGLTLQDLQS